MGNYKIDHDLHIHSQISTCSSDPLQTPENILTYAKVAGHKTICLTDHFWDKKRPYANEWYVPQDLPHVKKALPLPQKDGIRFLFGCETDMNDDMVVGIDRATCDEFDFIIVPTTHMHMFPEGVVSFEARAKLFVERFDALLKADLPFEKVGLAHITCPLLAGIGTPRHDHVDVLKLVSDYDYHRLFAKTAKLGMGVEINLPVDWYLDSEEDMNVILTPYRIAKEEGCKFYLGSDAHHLRDFIKPMMRFRMMIDMLNLNESDKFHVNSLGL